MAALDDLAADALFCSPLQPSEDPDTYLVRATVRAQVRHLGEVGCAALVAQEFGEHPEDSCRRMRWAISLTQDAYSLETA